MNRLTQCLMIVSSLIAISTNAFAQDSPSYIASLPANLPSPTSPALRDELLAMAQRDQAVRQKMIANHTDPAVIAEMNGVDARDTARMRQIVAQYGWPTFHMVGLDGEEVAALLVQHADLDPTFQAYCLPLEKSAAERGDAMKPDIALLTDRVRLAQGKKQVYGTQFTWGGPTGDAEPKPLEDPAHVDQRRASMGLVPLAQYRQMLLEVYKLHPKNAQ